MALRGSRGGTSDRDRTDERAACDVFTKDLDLPCGRQRELVRDRERVYEGPRRDAGLEVLQLDPLTPGCHAEFRRINLRWHDLRHEYASRLVEKNVPRSLKATPADPVATSLDRSLSATRGGSFGQGFIDRITVMMAVLLP
jgi:hypothetical protein